MRVLHVITDLRMGGAETALVSLALASRRAGHRVEVLSLKQLGAAAEPLVSAGIPCRALDAPDAPGVGTAAAALGVASRLRTDPPDVVHAWLASACAAVKLGAPVSVPRVFACRVTTTPGPLVLHLLGAGDGARTAWCAVSSAVADAWSAGTRVPRHAFHVIPNGVVSSSRRAPEPRGARPCFLGRLAEQKGVDVLLTALVATDLHVDIHGDGPERAALERMASLLGVAERAHFQGTAADPRAALRAASMLVLPTRAEGMSNAVLEAMAEGRPVVVTDVPGMRELVEDGVTGVVVPPGRARALADAVAALQSNARRRRTLGDAARKRAAERFSLQASHDAWLDLYDALLRA